MKKETETIFKQSGVCFVTKLRNNIYPLYKEFKNDYDCMNGKYPGLFMEGSLEAFSRFVKEGVFAKYSEECVGIKKEIKKKNIKL